MKRETFPSGRLVKVYDSIDSTSSEAKRLFQAGENKGGSLWVIAARQTNGYGRRASEWVQSEGDVAASLILPVEQNEIKSGQLSYVVAIAIAELISSLAPKEEVLVKWPNDVLVNGSKISGILLELITTPENKTAVVIGVGINVVSKPVGLEYPTARLIDFMAGDAPTPVELVSKLDRLLEFWQSQFHQVGFLPIRDAWMARAAGIGANITVRMPTQEKKGIFQGISTDGALMLESARGIEEISAGTVFFE